MVPGGEGTVAGALLAVDGETETAGPAEPIPEDPEPEDAEPENPVPPPAAWPVPELPAIGGTAGVIDICEGSVSVDSTCPEWSNAVRVP
jgi:hypothetical protein